MYTDHKIPESVKYAGALLVVLVLMIVGVLVYCCYRRRKEKARQWKLIPQVSVVGKPKITLEGKHMKCQIIIPDRALT